MNRRTLIKLLVGVTSILPFKFAEAKEKQRKKRMPNSAPNVVIGMPSQLFTMARSFKAIANGSIYIGEIDTDPTIPSNQIEVLLAAEDGSLIPVSQPLKINAGGYPVYNGQIAKFVTVKGHSMAVYDSSNAQQFYYPNVLKYDPDQLRTDLSEPGGASLIGTESGATVQEEIDSLSDKVSQAKKSYSPCISFVFDDAKATHFSVVAPLFNSKSKSCGFAINTVNINTATNMLGSDILELASQGFEIINHAYTGVPFNSGVNDTFVRAELETAQSLFATMGLHPKIMQTPSSLAPASMQPVIRSMFEYAFTQASKADPMKDVMPTELWRFGLESGTGGAIPLADAKAAVDGAKAANGVVVFYAHDVPAGGDKFTLISNIIDYAESVGVKVLPPSLAVASATSAPNIPSKEYSKGVTLLNSTNLWTANNGTIVASANGDLTVTATAAGTCLIQRSSNMQMKNDESINFSAAIRNLTGSVTEASIGMNTSSDADVIKRIEYPIIGLDTQYRRYSVAQQIGTDVTTALTYVRVTFAAAGDRILIRLPTVRYGLNVLQDANLKSLFSVGIVASQTIPNNTSSYTNISLTSAANNGLFAVAGNAITFSRPCKIMLSVSILSNSGGLAGNTGGLLKISFASDSIDIPSSPGTALAGASHAMTLSVDPRSPISFSMLNSGSPFGIYSASTIRIQEI